MRLPFTDSKNPVTILKHVIKAIEDEPLRYDQNNWLSRKNHNPDEYYDTWPACDTVACVGGWIEVLTRNTQGTAMTVLGLNEHEQFELFYTFPSNQVPAQTKRMAEWGVKHIKRFVKKKWGVSL